MEKSMIKKILLGIAAIFTALAGGYGGKLLGAYQSPYNPVNSITQSTTSTATGVAVKVLTRNLNRRYAFISNASTGTIFLAFENQDVTASSTLGINGYVLTTGQTYVIGPDNMITTDVYASSTQVGYKINFGEI